MQKENEIARSRGAKDKYFAPRDLLKTLARGKATPFCP